jgi:putative oxidoreductase
MDIVLVIVRAIVGVGIAAHGAQKLFGAFGGHGLSGTGKFFEKLGFRPGGVFAMAAGSGEFFGGLLTAVGLLGPIGPAIVILVMLVAVVTVHLGNGFFAANNGVELPLAYAASALLLAFAGPGPFSLDVRLGLTSLWALPIQIGSVVVAVVLALVISSLRRHPKTEEAG